MRIDVRKVLFIGSGEVRDSFFEEAQRRGIVEFIDPKRGMKKETPAQIQTLMSAIKVVRGLPVAEQLEGVDLNKAPAVAEAILKLHHSLEKLHEEQRILRQEIARVEPFGEFCPSEIERLKLEGGRHLQFFVAKHSVDVEAVNNPEMVHIRSSHGMDYFVAINKGPRTYDGMIEMIIEEPLQVLERRMRLTQEKIREQEATLKTYADRNQLLHEALVDQMNLHELSSAEHSAQGPMEGVFAVEGWVPEDKLQDLHALVRDHTVHFEEIAVEEHDKVPTYLENEGFARIGEDLVHIYDTPSTADKDPSPWVLWSFALFFAMILGDGGYGLLFLGAALFLRFKMGKQEGMGKRMITLALILSTSCVFWGLFTHSFFGLKLDIDSSWRTNAPIEQLVEMKAAYHLRKRDSVYTYWVERYPQLREAQTPKEFLRNGSEEKNGGREYTVSDKFYDALMLEFALLVGVIHVSLGFLRNIRVAWAGLGWIAVMAGGYLYIPEYLGASSMIHFGLGIDRAGGAAAGMQLLTGGIGVAVLLSVIQNRLAGLGEILNLIQVFSDVLSYLRLYALGLAGGMMSATFNEIGASLPIVAGVAVILVGHMVNIVLSIMGGVIHGLRLNFIEWYHYCFDGGGKMFRPLTLQKVR